MSRGEAGHGPAEELEDAALREEIELLAEVMAAAAEAPQPLCQAEVDRALHLADAEDVDGSPGKGTP